ncbi:MAG: restriction endonuclease subunit S [Flavobacteriales bacterium]|nr:restriction endonuclease subunit S [Flavobacteriales bacterium]
MCVVQEGDVLLNITGDRVARCCRAPPTYPACQVQSARCNNPRRWTGRLINGYLFYQLIYQKPELLSIAEMGATRKAITKAAIEQFEVCAPEPDEQRAIAAVLSSLDAKIDLLHRQNKTLEAMAETLFRQWFVEEAEEGWRWVQLSEHIRVHRGLSYTGAGLCGPDEGVPMHNLNSVYEGGGYKYVGIKYYKGEYRGASRHQARELIITNTEQGRPVVDRLSGDRTAFPRRWDLLAARVPHRDVEPTVHRRLREASCADLRRARTANWFHQRQHREHAACGWY